MRKRVDKGVEKKKTYAEEVKRVAVAEYKTTGNASAVARKYGVPRTTLLAWVRLFPAITVTNDMVTDATIEAINRTSEAVVRSIDVATATRQQFLMEHYGELGEAISLNLQAIITRLRTPEGIPYRDLAATLTALSGMVKEFLPVEEQTPTQINLLQQTINN
jgi:hypothetical protein